MPERGVSWAVALDAGEHRLIVDHRPCSDGRVSLRWMEWLQVSLMKSARRTGWLPVHLFATPDGWHGACSAAAGWVQSSPTTRGRGSCHCWSSQPAAPVRSARLGQTADLAVSEAEVDELKKLACRGDPGNVDTATF